MYISKTCAYVIYQKKQSSSFSVEYAWLWILTNWIVLFCIHFASHSKQGFFGLGLKCEKYYVTVGIVLRHVYFYYLDKTAYIFQTVCKQNFLRVSAVKRGDDKFIDVKM